MHLGTPHHVPSFQRPFSSILQHVRREARQAGWWVLSLISLALGLGQPAHAQGTYVFPSVINVGSSSTAQTVSITIKTAGVLGTVRVLTQGSPNLDFALSGGTCATGTSYSPGQTCTVSVVLSPRVPGVRSGAVTLADSGGNPLGNSLLYGMGAGPLSVMTAGEINTVAGNGHLSSGAATGTSATDASIHEPLGVAVDGAGNFYYTDSGNDLIDKVDGNGNLTIVAGTGSPGFSPNGTPATSALISEPSAILVDGAGNIFFTEIGNSTVREVVQSTGLIQTVAGTGAQGYAGDGAAASSAVLNQPEGLAIDASGNLYVADTQNNVIRKIDATTGIINTIAGNLNAGFAGDGQLATAGQFNEPWGLFAAADGSLYIADYMNNRVRRIDPAGRLSTVAGNGTPEYTGDNMPASAAGLNHPVGVVLDAASDVFISDSENNVIRKINGATQIITTLAGNSAAASAGDGTNADAAIAGLNKPYGLTVDGGGNIFIADRLGLAIREIYGTVARIMFRDQKVTNLSATTVQRVANDGNAPLHISAINPVSNAVVNTGTTTCSTTTAMNPGAVCVIGVQFKPATVGSPVNGLIDVSSDSAVTPGQLLLFGNSLSIEPTTTTLVSSVNPSAVGSPVTFTATVASNSTTLTGSVQFFDGTTLLGGAAQLLNSTTRKATLTTTALTLGTHSITAVYSGDNANQTSTSAALLQVVKQTSALQLVSNLNPAEVYQTITFTVTASETPAGGVTPTGSVVFSADGSLLPNGTIALSNGSASYNAALLAAGTHTITASYSGDDNNLPANSTALSQVVNLASTTTTLSTSNSSVPLTTPVTFTATVAGSVSTTAVPSGNVVFKDGTTMLATAALNTAGAASFTTSSLATGSHSITAAYQSDSNFAASVSAALTETIQKIATTASVSASANPANAGAAVQFTVFVTAANNTSPNVPITGSVTLMEGAAVLGTGVLTASGSGPATASATISISSLATGSHAISAVYAGDTNYVGSTSSAMLENIVLASTTTVLKASTAAAIANRPVVLTATVSGTGGTPTGTVNFTENGAVLGASTLVNGVGSFTTSTLAVGTHVLTALYLGDPKDSGSTSNTVTIVISSATTTVALTPSQNPTNFGQNLVLAAKVSGNGGVPTGTITFSEGSNVLQSGPVNANGVATYSTSTLTDGAHTFTASYGGDANDLASQSSPLTITVLQTISLTLSSTSPNPSIARSNVHFVATITPLQGIQPTGNITFKEGATVLGSGVITGTTATFDTAALSVGTHAIVAAYAGDSTTEPLSSAAYSQTVNAAGAAVTLTSNANPATFGALLTFTAVASSTAGPLTGTVKFQDGSVTIGSGTLSSTGVATFATSSLTPGVHSIVAAYQGDANDQPASSSVLQQLVERATTVALTSSQNPQLTLAPVTITAAVKNGGTVPATGTIIFSQDATAVATVTLDKTGTASYTASSLLVGTHAFTASYSGDAVDLPSSSASLNQVIQLRPTSDTLTTSATSLTGGQQITLISVLRWDGPTTPTGTVTFLSGALTLATVPVDASGVATVTVLLSGTSANVSSMYSGDANYAPSVSASDLVTIGPAPDFTLAATPLSFTLASKEHKSLTITVASVRNFTDTLSFGCLGLPHAATCSFSKDQMLLPAGATQSVLLTVDTGNPLLAGAQARSYAPIAPGANGMKLALGSLLPGGVLLALIGFRFKRLPNTRGFLMLLCLAALSATLIGCGTVNMVGTPAGTYNFNVSVVGATGVSESIPITMVVTQ